MRVQCLAAPIDPLPATAKVPLEAARWRLSTLVGLMREAAGSLAGEDTLKLFLAPELLLTPRGEPISESDYHQLLEEMRQTFSRSQFTGWLLAPGSLCFQSDGIYCHVAHLFQGGTDNISGVLKQDLDNYDGRSAAKNIVTAWPDHPLAAGGHPAKRVDDFLAHTGLRIGMEIGGDHRAGLLWSTFASLPQDQLQIQIVPSSTPALADEEGRILAHTVALNPSGLLLGCCPNQASCAATDAAAQLYQHLGDGRFRVVQGTGFVSRHGRLICFPPLNLKPHA